LRGDFFYVFILAYFDTMNKEELLLEVRGLTAVFQTGKGQIKAVDDISFTLAKGEVLGIVGESGSGKSVTALSIMQLIKPQGGSLESGSILYYKNNESSALMTLTAEEKQQYRGKDVAMIFQEPMTSLNPVIRVGKQVAEAIQAHSGLNKNEAKAHALMLFEKVQLPSTDDIYNSYPHQLSGGQKQRVMIAMALSSNPAVLIADEPTTALDVTVQASILNLLKQLQAENGMSIIFITHDLGVIANLADRVMVMYKGRVVETSKTDDIFKNPKHPYTKGLIACRPSLSFKNERLPVISDFMNIDSDGSVSEKNVDANHIVSVKESNEELYKIESKSDKQNPFIEVNNLSVHYQFKKGFFSNLKPHVKAVDDVSFNIYKGETLGLVGESGCGKSTLGRAILNLVNSSTGNVIYQGRNLSQLTENDMRPLRKNLQMIFQDPYSFLNPRITAGAAIFEPMRAHGLYGNDITRKERVMWLLQKVDLKEEHYYRYPHEFSGGQRQRIGIARALSLNPEFIICDESVSALDISVQAQVLNLLNELKREFNFTYIFISHDLSVVKYMSDRIMVMQHGKIVESGIADDIYLFPKSDYTKSLIAAVPVIN
jgi:peptide/nickel transport system ATP-binding protein